MGIKYIFLQMLGVLSCLLELAAGDIPNQSKTASTMVLNAVAISGIHLDQFAKIVLPEFKLRERRLSDVGIGYHYFFYNHGTTVIVTAGMFATAKEVRAAAELSHRLMPVKPNSEKEIEDQAWVWDDPRGCAVRFRSGRCLIRIAGRMNLEECRRLARRFALQLSADTALTEDVLMNDVLELRESKEHPVTKEGDYEKPYLRLRDEAHEGDLWCD
jgi:hypothetical protein